MSIRAFRLHWTLLVALAVGLASGLLTPDEWRWPLRFATGWNIGVGFYIIRTLMRLALTRSTDQIRARAAALDEAGVGVLPLSLIAAAASVIIVVGEAVTAPRSDAAATAGLVLPTVGMSWTFIHLIFAQHYAHRFYGHAGKGDRGGLIFPGETEPDYWDFVHFAIIIGVASQTADIQISSRRMRRIATLHSLTAFVFNTVIVALAVNFAISLIGS